MPMGASARMTAFRAEEGERGQPTSKIVPQHMQDDDIGRERVFDDRQPHPGDLEQDDMKDPGERKERLRDEPALFPGAQEGAPTVHRGDTDNRYATQGDSPPGPPDADGSPPWEPPRHAPDAMRMAGLSILPRSCSLLNPFSHLRYRGPSDSKHPMRFLRV